MNQPVNKPNVQGTLGTLKILAKALAKVGDASQALETLGVKQKKGDEETNKQ